MKRYVDMKEISDGRFYDLNDMVKADCRDCTGCSACCHGMGNSIVLDPYDMFRLSTGLGLTPGLLLAEKLELNVVEGIILPNLKMQKSETAEEGADERIKTADREAEGRCGFLDKQGRCSIHPYRPGICRLFPLGRYYEDGRFRYFLQTQECKNQNRGKVKVWKWIDTPESRRYDTYISDWHFYIRNLQEQIMAGMTDSQMREINLILLERFFLRPYETGRDFYEQFYERLEEGGNDVAT